MTDLSQRIMDAWLAVNPEPDARVEGKDWGCWHKSKRKLRDILAIEAYESAVIQFLVPEGWGFCLYPNYAQLRFKHEKGVEAGGSTLAEALLNAILAAREV